MLRFEHLNKAYGQQQVLRDASHRFGAGAFALQGPNGTGKSTLLAVLAGVEPADSGSVHIDGHSLAAAPLLAKASLSYVPDACPVYPFLSGREFLRFVASAKRCRVTAEVWALAERFGLGPHLDTRFGDMSLGTQKKTMLTAAWIGDPAVMLIDEPSNGLDQATRLILIELVRERRARSALLISTHDAEFVLAAGATPVALRDLAGAPARAA